jgi:molybdenum cofactor biosynthesis enzyme MoaA
MSLIRRKIDTNKVAPVGGGRGDDDEEVKMIRWSTLRQMMHARRSEIDTKAPEKRIGFAETTDKEDLQIIQSMEVDFCETTDQVHLDFNGRLSNFKRH